MRRVRNLLTEWKARRDGSRHVQSSIRRSARDIIGATGNGLSAAWDELERHGEAYAQSFDRRLPPSLHISHRDAVRHQRAIPLVERCIEDWRQEPDTESEQPAEPSIDS